MFAGTCYSCLRVIIAIAIFETEIAPAKWNSGAGTLCERYYHRKDIFLPFPASAWTKLEIIASRSIDDFVILRFTDLSMLSATVPRSIQFEARTSTINIVLDSDAGVTSELFGLLSNNRSRRCTDNFRASFRRNWTGDSA